MVLDTGAPHPSGDVIPAGKHRTTNTDTSSPRTLRSLRHSARMKDNPQSNELELPPKIEPQPPVSCILALKLKLI